MFDNCPRAPQRFYRPLVQHDRAHKRVWDDRTVHHHCYVLCLAFKVKTSDPDVTVSIATAEVVIFISICLFMSLLFIPGLKVAVIYGYDQTSVVSDYSMTIINCRNLLEDNLFIDHLIK